MSAADSSENCRTAVLAGRSGWRSIPWIAAAEYRLHLRLYAAHRWATKLGVVEGSSLYRILATALDQLLVLAKSAIKPAIKRALRRQRGRGSAGTTFGGRFANSRTSSGNARSAIVAGSKTQNGA